MNKSADTGVADVKGALRKPLVRAAQYVRMSTEHQKYSTQNQMAAITLHAERFGFEIVRTYADEGKSGLILDGRDAIKRLIADVQGGHADFSAKGTAESCCLANSRLRPPFPWTSLRKRACMGVPGGGGSAPPAASAPAGPGLGARGGGSARTALLTTPEALMTTKKRDTTKRTTSKTKVAEPATSRPKKAARNAATANTRRPSEPAASPAKRQTKKAIITALLGRAEGASINELMTATGWQAHSVRATLTGLRKTGREVARSKDDTGTTRYRLAGTP